MLWRKFLGEAISELQVFQVRPVERNKERRYQKQMAQHHYPGELPKIGETMRFVRRLFEQREVADFVELTPADHGRIGTRRIWCSTALNAYIDFPHVGQVFLIERQSTTCE